MNKQQEKQARLARRHRRVRGKISGTAARPRLCVTRSTIVGKLAQENGVTEVVFDRGGHLYHGRVKALAEAAREAGLKF